MSATPENVLYVAEFTTGGSVESLHSLVTGLDKTRYCPRVLFYTEPDPVIRQRFEDAGAKVLILMPGDSGASAGFEEGIGLQARIRKALGRRAESIYASLKYLLLFLRHKRPVFIALRKRMNALDTDIVHLNNGLASDTAGILAAASRGLPVVCHVRAFAVHAPPQVWAARFVSEFLCVSGAICEHLVEAGVDAAKTRVCHDSVNQQRFRETGVDRTAMLDDFGFNTSNRVFGLIGRLDTWKGHETFIDAISIARESNAAITGLIVGGEVSLPLHDMYVGGLHEQVKRLGLESAIVFTGHRVDVPEIIQCLDAVVCASSSPEPFGLMVVESMAVGTPVIATNAGGPAEMIKDGVDGLLVPLKDAAAMAEAMLRVADHPDIAKQFVVAGHETVASRFTVAHHVENVCAVYEDLLGSNR